MWVVCPAGRVQVASPPEWRGAVAPQGSGPLMWGCCVRLWETRSTTRTSSTDRAASIWSANCSAYPSEIPASHRRSEERRVGKECRSRWSPDDEKKKIESEQPRQV